MALQRIEDPVHLLKSIRYVKEMTPSSKAKVIDSNLVQSSTISPRPVFTLLQALFRLLSPLPTAISNSILLGPASRSHLLSFNKDFFLFLLVGSPVQLSFSDSG